MNDDFKVIGIGEKYSDRYYYLLLFILLHCTLVSTYFIICISGIYIIWFLLTAP